MSVPSASDLSAGPRVRWIALLVAAIGHGAVIAALVNLPGGSVAARVPSVLAVTWVGDEQPSPAVPEPQVKPHPLPMKPKTRLAPVQRIEPVPVPAPVSAPAEAPPAESAEPLLAAAPGAGAAPAAPLPIVAPRFDADYLSNPAPPYPSVSRAMGEQGKVFLRVLVTPRGEAQDVVVHGGSGHQRLDDAALEAVRHWKFVPARQGDEAVAAWVIVPISFTLRR
jgi:protein TonB